MDKRDLEKAFALREEGLTWPQVAERMRSMGVCCTDVGLRVAWCRRNKSADPPDDGLPIERIIDRKLEVYEAMKARYEASKIFRIPIDDGLPVGIVHFGDPHLDDDGCDIRSLVRHMEIVRETEGLYGGTVGDITNNWVGRLAKLYANQETSESTAWKLAEWFIGSVKWLYIVGGNHDVWSGGKDPLAWFSRQAAVNYQWHGVRLALEFPNGATFTINARHDFKGGSQWNPVHAAVKAAKLGVRDDLFISGHRHSGGYAMLQVEEKAVHCVMVAGYKQFDDYARQNQYPEATFFQSALTVFDPMDSGPNRVTVFADVEAGAEYLKFLRKFRGRG